MGLKLYFATGACSFVPHALLEAAGVEWEPAPVKLHRGEQNTPEFRALNPRGQVPVLVDDGEVITQIVAIVLRLEQHFPAAGILPVQGLARIRALERLLWMNNTVHPTFTHIFMPHKFTDRPDLHEDLRRYNTQLYRAQLAEIQQWVQAAGSGWLGGDGFGALDAYALTLARWGTLAGIPPAEHPVLWAHVQRVAAHPAAQRAIARERLQLDMTPAAG